MWGIERRDDRSCLKLAIDLSSWLATYIHPQCRVRKGDIWRSITFKEGGKKHARTGEGSEQIDDDGKSTGTVEVVKEWMYGQGSRERASARTRKRGTEKGSLCS